MPTLITASAKALILAHYNLIGPVLEQHFAGVPVAFENYPHGFDKPPHYHLTDVPLSEKKLLWLCHRYFAVEFGSWVPLPNDRDRLQFGRVLLEHAPDRDALNRAALTLAELLRKKKLEAIPLLDTHGIALWIPFADAPRAKMLRPWLERFCTDAVSRFPQLFTTEPNTHGGSRVHLHCSSNAPGRYSALPYSLRGGDALTVCTPVRWAELQSFSAVPADEFGERLEQAGDVFGEMLTQIGTQRFADLPSAGSGVVRLRASRCSP